MSNLKRKQIYLDEESDRALKMLAIETKISESEHIFCDLICNLPCYFNKNKLKMPFQI